MICRKCNRKFNLGEALQLSGTNKEADSRALKKSVRQIIEGVKTLRGVTDTIEFTYPYITYLAVRYFGAYFGNYDAKLHGHIKVYIYTYQ